MNVTIRMTERRDGGAVPSYSRQDPGLLSRLREEGWQVYLPGNGWAYLTMPARVLVEGEGFSFDVAPYFRQIGRITKKRAGVIAEEAPTTLEDGDGLTEETMREWLERVKKRLRL